MALAPGSQTSYNIAPGQSVQDQDLKRKMAWALMMQGTSAEPVKHWTQALARVVQGGLGGYQLYQADQADQEDRAKTRDIIGALMGGQPAQAATPQPSGPANAISSIESGGKYDAQGPVTKTGDRAYGKYQVMGSNVGPWTKEALGQEMTPQQFLSNPQAQDAVFNNKFGQYSKKYGPEGAARAWFAGEGGMNNLGAKDQLGTTVAQYGQKFAQAMPQGSVATDGMPVGAPVDQPRGGMDPNRRAALIQALSQTKAGAPYAQALLQQQLTQEANRVRPLTSDEKGIYPGAVAIEASGKPVFPPPSTNVALNANNSAESAYSKGKAEDALNLERGFDKTLAERQRLEVFRDLVQNFKTGKLAPMQTTLGAWADSLGVDPEKLGLDKNAAINGQLIESLSNQMTLGMIGGKGGEGGMPANNFSDADRKFLQNTVPGLARMQGGNLVLTEIKSRGLDRQLQKNSMWDDYRSQGKSYETFERDWRKKVAGEPSIFADIPDMVKQMQQSPGGAAPAGPSVDDLLKKYGPK